MVRAPSSSAKPFSACIPTKRRTNSADGSKSQSSAALHAKVSSSSRCIISAGEIFRRSTIKWSGDSSHAAIAPTLCQGTHRSVRSRQVAATTQHGRKFLRPGSCFSNELQFLGGLDDHPQQQHAMAPAPDIGFAPHALLVSHWQVDDLQVVLGGSEQQVEISEGIDFTEIRPVRGNRAIVLLAQHLGAAQRILEVLAEQPTEGNAKEFVADVVEEPHGPIFHGID